MTEAKTEVVENVPFKCPICGGTGKVVKGFYKDDYGAPTLDGYHEYCRSCNGSGIVFGTRTWKALPETSGCCKTKDG